MNFFNVVFKSFRFISALSRHHRVAHSSARPNRFKVKWKLSSCPRVNLYYCLLNSRRRALFVAFLLLLKFRTPARCRLRLLYRDSLKKKNNPKSTLYNFKTRYYIGRVKYASRTTFAVNFYARDYTLRWTDWQFTFVNHERLNRK